MFVVNTQSRQTRYRLTAGPRINMRGSVRRGRDLSLKTVGPLHGKLVEICDVASFHFMNEVFATIYECGLKTLHKHCRGSVFQNI